MIRQGVAGTSVAVRGVLTMCLATGPLEDELCAVRVSIEAEEVRFGPSEPST